MTPPPVVDVAELDVLRALAIVEHYDAPTIHKVMRRRTRRLGVGIVRVLDRLEHAGLVRTYWSKTGDPCRRMYRITDDGGALLKRVEGAKWHG